MCQLIRTMLRRNFQQRPSAVEMVDLPYVKECLGLSNSALVGKKKEKQMNAKTVAKGADEDAVVAFMKENADNEISITNALSHLNGLKVTKLKDETKKFVIQLMKTHMSEKALQIEASRLLLTIAAAADVEEDADDYIFSAEVIAVVCLGMKSHVSSKELQSINSLLLKTIALNEEAAGLIGLQGGIQDILSTMRAFPEDAEVCGNCCSALSCLTINDKNLEIMREEKGVIDLMNAMDTHEKEASVIDFACSALWGLSLEDENVEMMAERKAAEVLLNAIVIHEKNSDVVKNACMALTTLVGESEESAFAALNNDGGKSGLVIVQEVYQHHKDNPDVVENICLFFVEIAEYDDIVQDLSNTKIRDLIKDVKVKYASNEDIMSPAEKLEARLN
ncbi:Serine/threonine kinase-like domain-containing protein STKLD1 [Holothuria leucospilota]|uniref:non-specific serine/threonine protein kinase n=1 Tax=Holothuria leucospilota TaxID=206669 RepID=A0A9Q1HAS5_HOLLE|nr:Serine/threonine kinase-like domain-containing protein STKLD1 [Holothuria leucospilota]